MKRFLLVTISLFFLVALSGCKGVESCPVAGQMSGAESFPSGEENSGNMITSNRISQSVYAALQADWDAWNAKNDMQKAISSHMPGHCYKRFDTWTECEEFLGFSVFNPLENDAWPEKATYVGMPVGYNDAPRFYVSFYGTSEGQVEWLHVESGYRNDEIRIMVNAQILVDAPKETTDDQEPILSEDSGEKYVASTAVLARGPVTYSIRVVGEPNMQGEVQKTLEKVLPCFY